MNQTIVLIFIIGVVFVFFLFQSFKVFHKKKDRKKKVKKEKKEKKDDEVDLAKKPKQPKININKLKKAQDNQPSVRPLYNANELEQERINEIRKTVEKNKSTVRAQNQFMFPGFSFPSQPSFQNRTINNQTIANKVENNNKDKFISVETSNDLNFKEVDFIKSEDKDFIEALKQSGAINKNNSFGESLIIKEAIDTPAAKAAMKKKRQKWL